MKKIFSHMMLIAAMAIISASAMAQNSFSYQAVIRNNGEVVSNQDVSLLISILNGSDVCYQETQKVKTNAYGNISVSVGEGEPKTGSFAAIPWETMQVMMQVEVSTDGSENYVNMGQMQIQPVPYAIYAARTATVIQPAVASEDPIFEVRDNNGELMFAVYETGVKVYVDQDGSKAAKAKFAVAGRSTSKGEENLLTINNEGTTVYVDESQSSKAAKSKFAVAGRSAGKTDTDLLTIDGSGSTIYVDGDGKAAKSKFAVAGRSGRGKKSANNYSIDNNNSTLYVDFNDNAEGKGAQADVLTIDGGQATFYIDETESGKAAKSKFAVAGRSADKSVQTAFVIDGTGTLIYIDDNDNQNGKAAKSTFAVAGRSTGKGNSKFFSITPDSTRIYVNDDVDNTNNGSLSAGFAIVGMTQNTDLLFINKDSTVIKANTYVAEEVQSSTGEVSKLDVVFGIWSGSLKYQYTHYGPSDMSTDTIDYYFSSGGRNNFYGVDDSKNAEYYPGRGKYSIVTHYNSLVADANSVEDLNCFWEYMSDGIWYTDNTYPFVQPIFSKEGVNTMVNNIFFNNFSSISGEVFNWDAVNITNNGTATINIGNQAYETDKYTYTTDSSGATIILTYYVYKGIVLQINKLKTEFDVTTETIILKCFEFNEGEAIPSFLSWLKNSGVTNFSGMTSAYLGEDYGEGHYFVDLGLPSGNIWASCNVGAPSSYDLGSYLAWGETAEKAAYEQDGYSVAELISGGDNNNDAAWLWGTSDKFPNASDWCMPTNADWQELIDECVWIWVKDEKGVYVSAYDESLREYKGQNLVINSVGELREGYNIELINYIFLPATGFFDYSNINNTGQGYYWSSNKQDYGVNCLVFGESYQQIGNNPGYQGLQVRPVMHKSKAYWVKKPEGTPTGEATGSSSNPFSSIDEALSTITNDFEQNSDALMTYTIMVNGDVEPAEISAPERIKQITLCGANGLLNGEPQDAIVGNINTRPLTVYNGTVRIKNLKLTGGGINPENQNAPSQIAVGGGLYLDMYAKVTLDSGAFVMKNVACTTDISYGGGVYVFRGGELTMLGGSKISENQVGGDGYYGCGAGVYINGSDYGGKLTIYGGEISENKCVGSFSNDKTNTIEYSKGGGVYIDDFAEFYMYGGLITKNTIEESASAAEGQTVIHGTGGGVCRDAFDSRYQMFGGMITDNTAANAPGLYVFSSSSSNFEPIFIGGSSYISDIHFNFNEQSGCIGIVLSEPLTTNKNMSLTVENVGSDVGINILTYYTEDSNYNGQILRDAKNLFTLTNENYSIGDEIEQSSWYDGYHNYYQYSFMLVPQSK
ncbi:MAG: hypothetical protein IKW86_11605 [Salinivirgaceae bacterium]|nr:hypothetical protein [Salinivirgaceae bacterium]